MRFYPSILKPNQAEQAPQPEEAPQAGDAVQDESAPQSGPSISTEESNNHAHRVAIINTRLGLGMDVIV